MQRSFFLVIVCLALWITACQTSISVTAVPAPTFVVFMPTETSAPVSTLVMEQPIFAATATITGTPYPTRTPGVEAERSTPTRGPRPTGLVVITATPVVPPSPTPTPTPLVSNLPGQLLFLQGEMRPSLWAFSLGTGLVTELVPDVSQIAVLLQDELPYLFIAASKIIDIDGVDAYQFPLPELCLIENRCQNLQFSPDGRYLAYTAIIDPEIGCGSDGAEIHVWDVNTEEMVQRITGAGFAQWISESMFQYGRSGCEAGNTSLWDMKGRNSIGLGRGGITFWAPDRSSLAGYETTFFGFHADFWMYNIEDNQLFEPHQGEGGRYDTLCWKPDGSQLAYTWQEFQPPSSYEFIIGPRQLWGMDAESSDQQPLLQSEEFNYFIASGNEREWECQWREDWLQVREVPYTPVSTTLEPDDWGPLYCPLRGVCSTEKALAINVDSGEVKEWSALSQEFPTPLESGPDLASEPVFVSPDNFFALYSGMNNKGLWYVSEQGESYLLIPDGFNFIYLDD